MGSLAFTVFVVDDDQVILRLVSRILTMEGYVVETFSGAREFLAKVPRNRPGCAVVDMRMPGLDGLQVLSELARAGHTLPVVLMSGQADVPTSVLALRSGAVDFLVKPFTAEKLLDSVRRAVEKSKVQRATFAELAALRTRFESLSENEKTVARMLARGRLQKDIATELRLAESVVVAHRSRSMEKLGAATVSELSMLLRRLDHG